MIEVEGTETEFGKLENGHFTILERRSKMRYRKIITGVASAMLALMLFFSLVGVVLAAGPTADASRTIGPQVVEPRGTDDAGVFTEVYYPEIDWGWITGVAAGATKVVTYTLTVPTDAEEGEYAINGTVLADEVENPIGGNTIITVVEEIPPEPVQYDLTISSSAGGQVTEPGEGTFSYDEGTPVGLVATAADGYEFVNWTGSTGTMTNPNAAATTITMNGDYSITANFEEAGGGGGGGTTCGMSSTIDVLPIALVSVGLVATWATKRRRKDL
jgi:hypothetical protein